MHGAFQQQARQLGLNPSDEWVGGYVEYEWDHLRHVVAALPVQIAGKKVLEFGCNVGASAIIFASMGARVWAIDIVEGVVELARLNAKRYQRDEISFACITDTRKLPYPDGMFDLVSCNSVLEYVDEEEQQAVMAELARVLAPGGMILLTGTSNRLWPREVHSRKWLVNYLPRRLDRLFGRSLQRGMWPWSARHGFGPNFINLDSPGYNGFFARSRLAMGMPRTRLAVLISVGRLLGIPPGMLAPNLSCLLLKNG